MGSGFQPDSPALGIDSGLIQRGHDRVRKIAHSHGGGGLFAENKRGQKMLLTRKQITDSALLPDQAKERLA